MCAAYVFSIVIMSRRLFARRLSSQPIAETMATLAFSCFGVDGVKKFVDAKCIIEGQNKRQLVDEELWDEKDFDACVFDEDKMMTHILDCYGALCSFQQYRGSKEQSKNLTPKRNRPRTKRLK